MYDHYEHARWAGLAAPEQLPHLGSDRLRALGAAGDLSPGLNEPHKNEALGLQAEGFKGNGKTDNRHSEASHEAKQARPQPGKRCMLTGGSE